MRTRSGTALAALVVALPALGADTPQLKFPVQYFYDQNEQLIRIEKDTNQDGRVDQWEFYAGDATPTRIEKDENFDGNVDLWQFLDAGTPIRQEQDRDHNGKIDLWIDLDAKGRPAVQREDTKGTGIADTTLYFKDGKRERLEIDPEGNGKINEISFYRDDRVVDRTLDRDEDGRPEVHATYGADGTKNFEEQDSDGDGKFDLEIYFEASKKVRTRTDSDRSGRFDRVAFFDEAEKLEREEVDTNDDGRADAFLFFENNRRVRQETDGKGFSAVRRVRI